MRRITRDDLTAEVNDQHTTRQFHHNGVDVTEHVFLRFDKDLDNKFVNVMAWESGPAPRPYVHQQFRDGDNIDNVRAGVQNAFDGIDWEWWRDRFAALDRAERGIPEDET